MLGNGPSIAVSNTFSYSSLLEHAVQQKHVKASIVAHQEDLLRRCAPLVRQQFSCVLGEGQSKLHLRPFRV
ncbi:DUF4917 family protein [Paraburkholderia graminis]|uniref:DUF4917 family protein n=1 Tax=Paraburkholderia graminis TaxID=60548 RepID=UPI0038BB8AFE